MPDVTLDRVSVHRGASPALDDVSFTAPTGAITVVMGASGSGKTSVLRAVAGLDQLTAGRVVIGDRDVTTTPPGQRDVSMTFAEAALIPTRTVAGNIAFPLELRQTPTDQVSQRVGAEARVLHIEELLRRRDVSELSVGEAHMVQLARALVQVPSVLLLDEPFAALEGERAAILRREVKWLQGEFGTTTLMTSNDPLDARVLGDHVAVLESGRLTQFGGSAEVVDDPATTAAAQLTGDAAVIRVSVETDSVGAWLVHPAFRIRAWQPALRRHSGRRLQMIIRPEWWETDPNGSVIGTVSKCIRWAGATTVVVEVGDHRFTMRPADGGHSASSLELGAAVRARLTRWVLIDPLDGFRLDLST